MGRYVSGLASQLGAIALPLFGRHPCTSLVQQIGLWTKGVYTQ